MPSFRSTASVLLAASTAAVSAWNTDVHQQIGFLAEEFLTKYTTSVLAQFLEPEYEGSIGRAAAWADAYAHTDEGAYSYQWHWIDSADDPPSYCNVYYHRDCRAGGCVVSALANQTSILGSCIASSLSSTTASAASTNLTCAHALKWVTHFIGDIAQPLHASGRAAGGNGINVTFANATYPLHAVWDGLIIYADAGVSSSGAGFSNSSLAPWFAHTLLPRIRADAFAEPVDEWVRCADPARAGACALAWAREGNAWNCEYVYARDMNGTTDLAESGYAEGAYPIVEMQVSKAAVKLAAWLNRLVEGGLEGEERGSGSDGGLVVQDDRRPELVGGFLGGDW